MDCEHCARVCGRELFGRAAVNGVRGVDAERACHRQRADHRNPRPCNGYVGFFMLDLIARPGPL